MIHLHPGVAETGEALAQAAQDILERMFFRVADEVCETAGAAAESPLESEISFYGAWCGSLRMAIPERLARELAANFAGSAELAGITPVETAQVLCELTNMICGATLSHLAPHEVFDLNPPEMVQADRGPRARGLARCLQCGEERIELDWHWQRTQLP